MVIKADTLIAHITTNVKQKLEACEALIDTQLLDKIIEKDRAVLIKIDIPVIKNFIKNRTFYNQLEELYHEYKISYLGSDNHGCTLSFLIK